MRWEGEMHNPEKGVQQASRSWYPEKPAREACIAVWVMAEALAIYLHLSRTQVRWVA